jgi:hypothetical protein
MTAREIIDEIRQLPPSERAQVVDFIQGLQPGQQLTPQSLEALAQRLAGEEDPKTVSRLKQEIVTGFYGNNG